MQTIPLVTSQSLAPVAQCLTRLSLPVDRWLQTAHIPADLLRRADGVVPLHACYRFLHLVVRDERLFELPMLLSERVSPLDLGDFGRALRRARTVDEYLRMGTRMITTHSNSGASLWLTREGDMLRVHQRLAPADDNGPAIVDAFTLSMTLRFLRRVFGAQWQPVELALRAGSEAFLSDAYLGAASYVSLGRPYTSFTLPLALMVRQIPRAATPGAAFEEPVDTEIPADFLAVLERLMNLALDEGRADIRFIADLLDISPRALQRRFAKEGIDYRSLLSRCRIERAKRALESSRSSVASIASELGYTDASNFARAFRKATGAAPAEWRRPSQNDRQAR